jgi:quercetin dioxygenase-like cupin family protein
MSALDLPILARPAASTPEIRREIRMLTRRLALVLCCLALAALAHRLHAQAEPHAVSTTPSEMRWSAQGGLAMAGMEQANLVGNPSKHGPYTLRLKFPAGYKLAPHTHPDDREVTILSGTWYIGYGQQFDEAALKALPAGSFYTEPANVAHFIAIKEPVIIQVRGTGPSGRTFVSPADNP